MKLCFERAGLTFGSPYGRIEPVWVASVDGRAFAMKFNTVLGIMLTFCATIAFGQAPFTILRPVNGASVRENVKIEVPRRSIPTGGYIGIYLDGVFIEAVAPTDYEANAGQRYRYLFDTKARKVSDGNHTFEIVLYGGEPTHIIDRSKVNVTVANNDIQAPKKRMLLRHKFTLGVPLRYRDVRKTYLISISKEEEARGSTPTERLLEEETIIYELLPIRKLDGSKYIVRSQRIPPAYMPSENGPPVWIHPDNLKPVDQIVSTRGENFEAMGLVFFSNWNPNFGSGSSGSSTENIINNLVGENSFSILPADPVTKGDAWFAYIDIGNEQPLVENFTKEYDPRDRLEVRGELQAFEWSRGYKTARLAYKRKQSLPMSIMRFGGYRMRDVKMTIDETDWFAYESGKIIHASLVMEYEGLIDNFQPPTFASSGQPSANSGYGSQGSAGGPPGYMPGSVPGAGMPSGMGSNSNPSATSTASRVRLRTIMTSELIK
jgi:hypothetical protein